MSDEDRTTDTEQVQVDDHGVASTTIENAAQLHYKEAAAGEDQQAQTEAAPAEDKMSDSLRGAARSFGYSDDEIEELGPDRLQADIARMDRRILQLMQPQQQQFQQQPAPAQQGQHPAPQSPPQQQTPQFDWKALEEEYDEGIVAPLKAMHERMEQMQSLLNNYEQQQYAADQYEFDRWFDDQLSELGDAFSPVVGKGGSQGMNPYSPEAAARQSLKQAWVTFRQIDQTSSDEDLVKRAAIALHPDVYQQQTRKQLSSEMKKRQRTTIGRPAGRRSHPETEDALDPSTGAPVSVIERLQERIDRAVGYK